MHYKNTLILLFSIAAIINFAMPLNLAGVQDRSQFKKQAQLENDLLLAIDNADVEKVQSILETAQTFNINPTKLLNATEGEMSIPIGALDRAQRDLKASQDKSRNADLQKIIEILKEYGAKPRYSINQNESALFQQSIEADLWAKLRTAIMHSDYLSVKSQLESITTGKYPNIKVQDILNDYPTMLSLAYNVDSTIKPDNQDKKNKSKKIIQLLKEYSV